MSENKLANIEAEQALLGALLIDNDSLERVDHIIAAHHFSEPLHGKIFDSISAMIKANRLATPVTIKGDFLHYPRVSEQLSTVDYLGRLARNATTIRFAPEYAKTIYDLAMRRALINACYEVITQAEDADLDIDPRKIISDAEASIFEISATGKVRVEAMNIGELATRAIAEAEAARANGSALVGLSTGIEELDSIMGGMGPGDLIIIAARPGLGKAQPLDSKILLANGEWSTMGDLNIGDQIASTDGRDSRVVGIFPQGKKQIYRVTLSDGRTCEACAEHLWSVVSSKWIGSKILNTLELRDLLCKKRYQGKVQIMRASGDWGHGRALPVDPYILGILIGDGCMSRGTSFTTPSAHVVGRVREIVEPKGLSVSQGSTCEISWRIKGTTRGMYHDNTVINGLKEIGMYGLRSWEKFLPDEYLSASRPRRVQLMMGLMDTDGWVEKGGTMFFGTTAPRLADDVVKLLRSLGYVALKSLKKPKFKYKGELKNGREFYVITICGPGKEELVSRPERLERLKGVGAWNRNPFIKSVDLSRTSEAQCIRVSHSTSLYITDDYIVTHNTSLAQNIAINVAESGESVDFYSMEMRGEQVGARALAELSGVSAASIRRGRITDQELDALKYEAGRMRALNISVDTTPALTIGALSLLARRAKRKRNTSLIIVDYIGLMQGDKAYRGNRVQEITEITGGLKSLAKELQIPILALAQLSRDVEKREDKTPRPSDLRESGSIEQDADSIIMIQRDVGDAGSFGARLQDAVLHVVKNRHDAPGAAHVKFDGARTMFISAATAERMRTG
jgi:replicative DNA helicase